MTIPLTIGRYEPLHAIASGGMATVYLARARGARGFERHVALKVMHAHLAEDQEFVEMFLDEARMAANIRHPNVVSTLDVVEEDRQLFLVMEYVEGPSLQAIVRVMTKRRAMLPIECTIRITLDVLAGLHAAHEQTNPDGSPMNMVHRDVSPHNVLVGVDGVARIMDFGVARAENRINSTIGANPKGKLPYMPPEQIASAPLDRRADVYAAGIVLWELLTGKGLFRAENDSALMYQALHGATQSPSDVNQDVPQAISAVCMRALALKPDNRFATAADFAEALEAAAKEAQVAVAAPRVVGAFVKEMAPSDAGAPRSLRTPAVSSVGSGSISASTPASSSSGQSAPISIPHVTNSSTPVSAAVANPSVANTGPTPISMPSTVTSDSTLSEQIERQPTGLGSRPRVLIPIGIAASLLIGVLVWLVVGNGGTAPSGTAQQDASAVSSAMAKAAPTPVVEPLPSISPSATASSSSTKGEDKPSTKATKVPTNRAGPQPRRTGPSTFRPEEP